MSTPTPLKLPADLSYPIKIVSLDAAPSTSVERGSRLLSYSFIHTSPDPRVKPETRYGTWDSTLEGTIDSWDIKPGQIITIHRARESPVVSVQEPCKHGIQVGGMCGICGKDMTNHDYTGYSDASRANIQMTHSAHGPTVSLEEAQRIEQETADHLLNARKLSLIVDLDQTIVHATVDPTVGEWITEGEAWEKRRAKKRLPKPSSSGPKASTSTSSLKVDEPSGSAESDSEDEVNPNWEALKDVKKFRLAPEVFGAPSGRGSPKGKAKSIESEGCLYYIKPRPGLPEFLQTVSSMYEMHVYTMGTRAYAEEVCAAIDPERKYFGGRILSRDESGSLTQKSLQRLFPCDTSMVVIIDDRADVWEWSPNLVKVIPYDFFVGIGDINSSFLPKLNPIASAVPTRPPVVDTRKAAPGTIALPMPESSSTSTPSIQSAEIEEPDELTKKAMLAQTSLVLEAQLEERPLAKKQEQLTVAEEAEEDREEAEKAKVDADAKDTEKPQDSAPAPVVGEKTDEHQKKHHHHRKALLKKDDGELVRVKYFLHKVHEAFYTAYDSRRPANKSSKRARRQSTAPPPYDVTMIISQLRMETLQGVHILFSSVIPLDTKAEGTEIWRTAHMFGAKCYTELSSRITHVVAAKRGTVKVDAARKRGGIKIVWLSWFTDTIALWQRQDETPYLLDDPLVLPEPSSSPILDSNQISSDVEPDTDDWDESVSPANEPGSLTLDDVDWDAIRDEVDAAMEESDGDEDGGESANVSDDGDVSVTDESVGVASNHSTPRLKRKRLRSLTPSEVLGINGTTPSPDRDNLRSPLAKRKKIAAERTGSSRLKLAINAEELQEVKVDDEEDKSSNGSGRIASVSSKGGDEEGSDEEEGEVDVEDDFLLRELGDEWG
ncbi:hypothetical protein JAAARDRAFT_29174 [Jaapia argillacea MUCL 33604]|uniref:RNA polymerase II subunit A C-terminal domain phosphatase n=1 Tax=Jaapia argillacea MUCL 33604 TaxID=933084 RepID=A0A067QKK9_9AGAM|nr:hypothetical protein JAAARDRAFT_29174 [Jaapia argillacea MUCL 33604]